MTYAFDILVQTKPKSLARKNAWKRRLAYRKGHVARIKTIKSPVVFPSNDRPTTTRIARRLVRVPARRATAYVRTYVCMYVRAAGIFMRSVGNLHEILMTDHEDVSRSRPPASSSRTDNDHR